MYMIRHRAREEIHTFDVVGGIIEAHKIEKRFREAQKRFGQVKDSHDVREEIQRMHDELQFIVKNPERAKLAKRGSEVVKALSRLLDHSFTPVLQEINEMLQAL